MSSCSVTAAGDLLLAMTGNGRDLQDKLPAPQAPSFIALDKRSGKLAWADASPGENVLDGQWASPAFAVLGGVPQAIFPGGDGWLYSFEARPSQSGKPGLLWKFDCNPKESVWEGAGAVGRNTIVSAPVIWEGKVYVATGQDPEAGEGQADLWCIDPTRRGNLSGVGGGVSGDVSTELVVDRQGRPVAPRRRQAVDRQSGEQVRPNPASAVLWHYRGQGSDPAKPGAAKPDAAKSGGSQDFLNVMHRSLGMPAIQNGLLVIGDYSGLIHCLDAKTGRVLWVHDMLSAIWGSPLLADGRIYLGNQDGDVVVFALSARLNVLAKNAMGNPIYGTAAAAGDVLYIATQNHLFAIAADK
jgi:outer membrane protein assembly factor BamB